MKTTSIKVEGMTCGGCVASVTRALQAVSGVKDVKVQLAPGQADVTFDEMLVDEPQLRGAIEDAGFDAA
ncbi:MAG: heavy-metal-associated domain-containing protein [Myxococcales bacterium]|nr:heavy-metal-associated domain-containing protein [Myxococcales bacterium]